jgi:type II secretory pathway component PulC
MNLKRYLLLINICFTVLILWVASNIVLTWASKKQSTSLPRISQEKPTSSVATSSESLKKIQDYQSIIRYDVFDTTTGGPAVPVTEEKTIKSTELDLKLKGTVVGENRNSYAIILDGKTNKEDLYYLNDIVQGARIVQVLRDQVVIELKGVKEVLLMEDITETTAPVRPEKKKEVPKKRKTRRRPVRRR